MELSQHIQDFIAGTDPETYGRVLGLSLVFLLLATIGYKLAERESDHSADNNLWGLLSFVLEWTSHVLVIVAFASVVGFAYGSIPEAFIVSAPVAVLVQRRALG